MFSKRIVYIVDTIIGLSFFTYLFVSWLILVIQFSHILFIISVISLVVLILSSFLIDWFLSFKRKGFSIQLLFNILILILYCFILFLFTYILLSILYLGFIIFLILAIFKGLRIYSLLKLTANCRKAKFNTTVTLVHFKKNKLASIIFVALFLLPLIVFVLGLTPYSGAFIEIDVNNQRGADKGSNELQFSFYATLGSYDYLTDQKILGALNGSAIGEGDLKPVEILLLVSDAQLKNENDSIQLAHMVRKCTQNGLKVWIWFVYDLVEGHYPSHQNYDYLPEFKDLFDDWVSNHSLDIHGMLFDNEMDELDISSDNLFGSLEIMLQHRNDVRKDWDEAVKMYKSVAEEWSDEGYKIALVGMDLTLIDTADGDSDVQQLYGIVDDPPDMWERVSFMFYRGCEYHDYPWGRDYLYNMADCHKKSYGDRAVVAIGCMAYAAYKEVDDILKDIAILKFLNFETVELFEFRAFYAEFGYKGLIEVLESALKGWMHPKFIIYFTTFEYFSRALLFLADILLDWY